MAEDYFLVRNGLDREVMVVVELGGKGGHARSGPGGAGGWLFGICEGKWSSVVDSEGGRVLAVIEGPVCPGDMWVIGADGSTRLEKAP